MKSAKARPVAIGTAPKRAAVPVRFAAVRSKKPPASSPVKAAAKAATARKQDRFAARIDAREKALLEDAAALQGRTLTDFVMTSAQETAHRVLREASVIELGRESALAFAKALLAPAAPNAALRRAMKRGRDFARD